MIHEISKEYFKSDETFKNEGFSMASSKRSYANEMMLDLFLPKSELDPNGKKIQTIYQELRNLGVIAA